MSEPALRAALRLYASTIRHDRRANQGQARDGTALELLLAPRMQGLIEAVLATLMPQAPNILPEFRTPGIGRPDLAFKREGAPARSFIELKQPETSLDPRRLRGHDADQFRRFRELPLWGFCNFHTIHLYKLGDLRDQAVILPAVVLEPGTTDTVADRLIDRHDIVPFVAVLEMLALAQPVPPRDARAIAESLAHAARLVRQIVTDLCRSGAPPALSTARAEFRETLFAHAASGGYDVADENALFGNAFAQTLAFGLLLAREASGREVDRDAYRLLPEGLYPLLRVTLRVLTQEEILDVVGIAFDVMLDTVNAIDTGLLAERQGHDPILYFYEDFLQIFDPDARRRHGVFFTPVPIVRFMVAATDRALSGPLGTDGLLDPNVLLLDPACGTGTFLIAAASAGIEQARARYGEGALAAEATSLAARLHGFEILVGPYTVAHYRMLREVARHCRPTSRLPIFLADTLASPAGALGVVTQLGFMSAPILAERRDADALKQRTPILAIIGNPPYRRLAEGEDRTLFAGWAEPLWNDLKRAVQDAGWGGDLNTFPELSVAFWRWCIWKLFESEGAPGKGVVCLITNRTFLSGHPYAGLRQSLRRHFDRIDIVDLRGDLRGARPAGIEEDDNVFDVQVGVCIVVAVAGGGERAGAEAVVRYADVWRHGAFTARSKKDLLNAAVSSTDAIRFHLIPGSGLKDFVAAGFDGLNWLDMTDAFLFRSSGIETKRDSFSYGFSRQVLEAKWQQLTHLDNDEARTMFHETAMSTVSQAISRPLTKSSVVRAAYRPLDMQYQLSEERFVDRPRPALRATWGGENTCLYCLPSGTGAGPAVWTYGKLPDRHAFRGNYGGYAFPLWDRRRGADTHNLSPILMDGLAAAYGSAMSPEDVFDAVAALLSATSYTLRFASDLEESFAHIPFPADYAVFAEAVRIGGQIRALATFGRPADAAFHAPRLAGRATGVVLDVPRQRDAFIEDGTGRGAIPLLADQSLRLVGVSQRSFFFAVSGYRVLYRWLAARRGEAIDAALQRDIIDIARRLEELLHWFDAADAVLTQALAAPLTRAALGFPPRGTNGNALD